MKNKSRFYSTINMNHRIKENLQNQQQIQNKREGNKILNSTRYTQFKQHFDDLQNIMRMLTDNFATEHQNTQRKPQPQKNISLSKDLDDLVVKKKRKDMHVKTRQIKQSREQVDIWSPQLEIFTRKQYKSFKSETIIKQPDLSVKNQQLKFVKQNKTNIKSNKIGIRNIGNTCYINSIVQCLFHLPHFNKYFQDRAYIKQNNGKNKNVVQLYRNLYVNIMNDKLIQQVSTLPLKKSVSNICSLFIDWQQEDAHQFMNELFRCLHEQLNLISEKPKYKSLEQIFKDKSLQTRALIHEQYELSRDNSYIYDNFCGQIYNNIKCSLCHHRSQCFQNFLDLSLPIVSSSSTLDNLLKSFFTEEKLNDYYNCQKCKKSSKFALKKMELWKLPKFLIIHLKRSQFGHKNTSPIAIPETLKLKQYMTSSNHKTAKFCQYNLCGMIMHKGVIDGGHYWSNVKQKGKWYSIDDDNVKEIENEQFKRQICQKGSINSYILFYSSFYC